MQTQDLLNRVDVLIDKGMSVISQKRISSYGDRPAVGHDLYAGFRSICLSFIVSVFGEDHVYHK